MDDKAFWDMAFVTIASMRFHPKNIPPGETLDEDELNELDLAQKAANEMLIMRKLRWQL